MDSKCDVSYAASMPQDRGFMRLPRELRDAIYELTLIAEKPIDIMHLKDAGPFDERVDLCPALLRLSRQVYGETIPVLYGLNTFRATIAIHCFSTNDFSTGRLLQQGVHSLVPSTFRHPGLSHIRRIAIQLHPMHSVVESSYDPCFADNILRALILDASPDIIFFEHIDFDSYWQFLARSDVEWASVQTALVVTESRDVTEHLLAYARLGSPKILVLPRPPTTMSTGYAQHTSTSYKWQNLTIVSEVPLRFARNGHFGKRGSLLQ